MSQRYTPRLPCFDYAGFHRYSLTYCTDRRRPVFECADVVAGVLLQFSHASTVEQFAVIAYCFMPDHVHLLVAGESPASDARDFLKRSKQLSGYWYSTRHQQRLWQRSAWDRVLRSEDDTLDVIRYLLANPVRAKLVSSPLEYPFSGSLVYTREQLLSAFHGTAQP